MAFTAFGLLLSPFALAVVDSHGIPGREQIFSVCVATVLLSVVLHGVTAYPLSEAYARYIERFKRLGDSEEHVEVPDPPHPSPHDGVIVRPAGNSATVW